MQDYAGMGWEDDLRDHSLTSQRTSKPVWISHTYRDHRFDPVVKMIRDQIARCERMERSLNHRLHYYWDMSPEQLGVYAPSEGHGMWLSDMESKIWRLTRRLKKDLRDLNVPEVSTPSHWCSGYEECSTCKEARAKFKKLVAEWAPLSNNIG